MKLEVVEGDIAALEVDAIATAANTHLWMGSGVAGAIKRAGGDEIEREAIAKGPIAVGDAVATSAGRLPAAPGRPGSVLRCPGRSKIRVGSLCVPNLSARGRPAHRLVCAES